ncbi:undecaprenyl-phosphate glucose phosphotransferase [Caballeronia sp. ATUFL_M2_KS44]|uniref:undecaprenyl-phosphate glucose phosphotransferase n=1 Tax=Caballeronia sp. ATUFL_M2_KS44 TaxID=2921767 RepID=UPI00254255E6|nr:undecaprenyl-phosphate glucose phosphotransferase [Caballeronia sp. ATUFL_M2_KS44]
MRLPQYSLLTERPCGCDVVLRLCEALVAAGSALMAYRLFGESAEAAHDSAAAAFAVLFAWAAQSVCAQRRAAPVGGILAPAFAWMLCDALATCAVMWMHREYHPSRAWFACWAASTLAGVILCGLVVRMDRVRRARTRSVAVVGRGDHYYTFLQRFLDKRDSVYRIDARFDMDDAAAAPADGIRRFQCIEQFAAYVRAQRIDELWLALPLTDEATLLRFLDLFRNDLLNIRFLPDLGKHARFCSDAADPDAAFAINLVAAPLTDRAQAVKDAFDRAFAACALLAVSPLFLLIALAVKVSSPGPVLFRQWRHGAKGEPFQIYKFRTMRAHAADDGVVAQATRGDARITRIGALLRRTSLDELPQFLNVLRGEMSVVGPRPHAIEHDALYQDVVDGYIHRYRIKPGITGWAQVNGLRGETDSIDKMQQRVEHDLFYLSNWSLAFDVRIVMATVVRGFVHHNAY